ncbi:MAG: hypothetical protein HC927_06405, partial [Deltaproteobacteria bacterium]|nr:hypothetical protein [Deltaproteobacteria bacterium]
MAGLGFLAVGAPLTALWNNEADVIAAGRVILAWCAIFQVFDAMAITYSHALRGAGDTKWPALLMAFCCWVVFIGGGLLVVQFA